MAQQPSFDGARTAWRGRLTSTPTNLQEGDWWYREDLNIFCYWDGAVVHCWGGTGGMLFSGDETIICAAGGDYAVNVTITSPWAPSVINHLVEIHFFAEPTVDPGTPVNPVITGNVVGFTLVGVGAGTTLTARAKVMGW